MDVSESSLFRELAQIDSRNRQEYQAQAKRSAEAARRRERLTVEKAGAAATDPFAELERDIVRTMLLHGDMEVEMEDLLQEENPDGTHSERIGTYRTTIAQEIVQALDEDGIVLRNETLRTVYQGIKSFVVAGKALDSSELLRVDDPEAVAVISSFLADEYILAGWQRMGVPVRDFGQVAPAYTRDLVLRYREVHVQRIIAETSARLSDSELSLEEAEGIKQDLKRFTEIRFRLNKELGGRVV